MGEVSNETGMWYHDFAKLGLKTMQRPGIYGINQSCKEPTITAHILTAMEYVRRRASRSPRVLELFCADGYYSHLCARWGAEYVQGIDRDPQEIALAREASSLLGHDSVCEFVVGDVFGEVSRQFDIVICAGGLYHLSDPKSLLAVLRAQKPEYLVCQSVVTLGTTDEDYFEAPAPGWTWGCRFTSGWLRTSLKDSGFEIIQYYENELLGNQRVEDRGSVYALCRPI